MVAGVDPLERRKRRLVEHGDGSPVLVGDEPLPLRQSHCIGAPSSRDTPNYLSRGDVDNGHVVAFYVRGISLCAGIIDRYAERPGPHRDGPKPRACRNIDDRDRVAVAVGRKQQAPIRRDGQARR